MSQFCVRYALLAFAITAAASTPLWAQDYPSRSLTIIVPLSAGTGMDAIARLYGEKLSESLGKPVIIENRPGANMVPPTQALIAAPADGHTLLVATPTIIAVNQTLYKKPPYDPEKELVPISHYLSSVFLLAVNPALPVKSVPEFLKYAKERPTPLNYSSPAGGGFPHYAVALMAQHAGLTVTHVPYKNSPQSIQDIAAGHVDFAFVEAGASRALIQDGKPRALAVSSRRRLRGAPRRAALRGSLGRGRFRERWRGTCWSPAPGHAASRSSGAAERRDEARPWAAPRCKIASPTWGSCRTTRHRWRRASASCAVRRPSGTRLLKSIGLAGSL